MAKVQSSRAKIYEKKSFVADEPTEHVESEGERLIKQLLLKQIDTKVNLADQLKQSKEFQKSADYVPLTKYTCGQISLREYEDCTNRAAQVEQLKSSGLTEDEVELILDHGKGTDYFSEKYKKLESSILHSRLQQTLSKIQTAEEQSNVKESNLCGVSRHERELGLSVKPNSDQTKLLEFALSCKQSSSTSSDDRPHNHPINHLKDLEQELFGHLRKKVQPPWKCRKSSPKFKSKQSTIVSSVVSKRPSTLWDVEESCVVKSVVKPCQVYTCKPETFYTIKNKKIVPLTLPAAVRSASHTTSGCSGQPFVVSEGDGSEVKTLSREDILNNRLSEEEIKKLPRFQNYDKGLPSTSLFLKNLPNRVKEADLVSVFGHLDDRSKQRIVYRLMTGKMKGQAFVTFPTVERATEALELVNGFILRKKPMIIEYGHTPDQKCKSKIEMTK